MTDLSAGLSTLRTARPESGGDAALRALLDRVPALTEATPEAAAAQLGPRARRPWMAAFLNAHAVNLCAADPGVRAAFASADLVLRDGIGMKILLRMLGRAPGANANGTDLIPAFALRPSVRVALYGAVPGVAEAAAAALRARGGHVVAARHGFHPAERYVEWLREDAPDIVILGMGAPRQERLALRLRAAADRPVGILCGGAVLDFLAGRVRRAPRWMRRLGLEWLHRLALEPRRLGRRYLIGNPLFLARAARLALRTRVSRRDRPTPS